jgi:regulator of replication initiation timing
MSSRTQVLVQKARLAEEQLAVAQKEVNQLRLSLSMAGEENKKLRKEMEECQESIRISDRLEVQF